MRRPTPPPPRPHLVARFQIAVLACALLAVPSVPAVAATTMESFGAVQLSLEMPAGAPRGTVLLVPGGTTMLKIADDGTPSGALLDNFVVRTREAYVVAGFAVALVSDPNDLRAVVARLRGVARPVFVVGTSRGTIAEARNAVALGESAPDGLVFTSSITVDDDGNVLDYALEKIAVPVLLVANSGDTCRVSPPAGMARIAERLSAAHVTQLTVFSNVFQSAPCRAASPHGYLGIEDATVAKIIAWMNANR